MRKSIILFLIAVCAAGHARPDSIPQRHDNISLQQALDSSLDLLDRTRQKEWEEKNLSGLEMLMQQQQEREARQKKQALIRIGVGLLFLGVLVFGWVRRKKKPVS